MWVFSLSPFHKFTEKEQVDAGCKILVNRGDPASLGSVTSCQCQQGLITMQTRKTLISLWISMVATHTSPEKIPVGAGVITERTEDHGFCQTIHCSFTEIRGCPWIIMVFLPCVIAVHVVTGNYPCTICRHPCFSAEKFCSWMTSDFTWLLQLIHGPLDWYMEVHSIDTDHYGGFSFRKIRENN